MSIANYHMQLKLAHSHNSLASYSLAVLQCENVATDLIFIDAPTVYPLDALGFTVGNCRKSPESITNFLPKGSLKSIKSFSNLSDASSSSLSLVGASSHTITLHFTINFSSPLPLVMLQVVAESDLIGYLNFELNVRPP